MNPMVLSRNQHAVLVASLERHTMPMATSNHFTLYALRPVTPVRITDLAVVHAFIPAQIDNNLGSYVANELLPLLATATCDHATYPEQEIFERYVGAIVRSMDGDEQRSWHLFYTNTLRSLRRVAHQAADGDPLKGTSNHSQHQQCISPNPADAIPAEHDFIASFGAIYQQVIRLIRDDTGSSPQPRTLLDVATCFGFLPLLLAQQTSADPYLIPDTLTRIVGCDLNPALVNLARDYAHHQQLHQVEFVTADILAASPQSIQTLAAAAPFDVVMSIHLLEHLELWQTEIAMSNLWQLTGQRLIIAVPFEDIPDPRFGHRQVFDQERLSAIGEQFGAPYHCFEYHGGWLVMERE